MNANPSVAGLEAIIERFESAWSSGQRPGIDDYLAGQCGDPQSLLMELVLTELEFRLKSGEAARVEEYLGRYPQLGDQRAATALLIRFEYLIRNAREPELDPAEFVWRFPDQYQCLFEGHDIHRDGMDVRDILARHPRSRQLQDQVGWPDNRFELDQMHAQGGLGTVWKARDKMFDRLVAIKEVKSQCALNERYQQRLRREARITARLEHPGIVPVYARGSLKTVTSITPCGISRATAFARRSWSTINGPRPGPVPVTAISDCASCWRTLSTFATRCIMPIRKT